MLLKPYGYYYAEYSGKVAELLDRFPLRAADHRRVCTESVHHSVRADPAAWRTSSSRSTTSSATKCLTKQQSQDYRSVYLNLYAEYRRDENARQGADQRQHRLRDRADQAGRDQRRLHPHAGSRSTATPAEMARTVEIRAEITQRRQMPAQSLRNSRRTSSRTSSIPCRLPARSTTSGAPTSQLAARPNLATIIKAETLRPSETRAFVDAAFRDGTIQTTGTAITKVLPPVSRFAVGGGHGEKKQRVLAKLSAFFERFFGLSSTQTAMGDLWTKAQSGPCLHDPVGELGGNGAGKHPRAKRRCSAQSCLFPRGCWRTGPYWGTSSSDAGPSS